METDSFLGKETQRGKTCTFKRCCCILLIIMAVVVALVLISGAVLAALAAGPLHASCKVKWDIGLNCSEVGEKLVTQMKVWHTKDNCENGGQRCLYDYKKTDKNVIYGTHETPIKHYIDDLTFTLNENGDECVVDGFSRSQIWYAILDYGTNYCNIHNLVEGARLNETKNYKEMTSDSQCTQYSSSDCDVY